jgi:hypothetical protein
MHEGIKGKTHRYGTDKVWKKDDGSDDILCFDGRSQENRGAETQHSLKGAGEDRINKSILNTDAQGILGKEGNKIVESYKTEFRKSPDGQTEKEGDDRGNDKDYYIND